MSQPCNPIFTISRRVAERGLDGFLLGAEAHLGMVRPPNQRAGNDPEPDYEQTLRLNIQAIVQACGLPPYLLMRRPIESTPAPTDPT